MQSTSPPESFPRRGGDMTLRPFSLRDEQREPQAFIMLLQSNRKLTKALRHTHGSPDMDSVPDYMYDYLNRIHTAVEDWVTLNESEQKRFRDAVLHELEWCPVPIEEDSILAEAVRLTELEYVAYPTS
jgi:hypothetical protein